MLDFRRHRRASKVTGPALERRMLMLLVSAGVVVLLMIGGGNPRNWRWLFAEPQGETATDRRASAPEHVVIAAADEPADDEPTVDSPTDGAEAGAGADSVAVPVKTVDGKAVDGKTADGKTASGKTESRDGALFPGVRGDYLSAVRDDTVFRPEESDGWFHLFALLEHTPEEALAKASEGPATHLQLAQQASAYRGHVVTVHGIVRSAKHVTAPANAFGINGYYQLWLQPDPASDELVVLYTVELPKGFPLGERIEAACTTTGIFYKRWAYQSHGGIATAPLVVAKTVDWEPPPAVQPAPAPPIAEQVLIATAVALILAALVLAFVVRRGWGARSPRTQRDAQSAVNADSVSTAMASLESRPPDAAGRQ